MKLAIRPKCYHRGSVSYPFGASHHYKARCFDRFVNLDDNFVNFGMSYSWSTHQGIRVVDRCCWSLWLDISAWSRYRAIGMGTIESTVSWPIEPGPGMVMV
jgi:hypothetical protein